MKSYLGNVLNFKESLNHTLFLRIRSILLYLYKSSIIPITHGLVRFLSPKAKIYVVFFIQYNERFATYFGESSGKTKNDTLVEDEARVTIYFLDRVSFITKI